jgi:YVTN family beta-propeller protein
MISLVTAVVIVAATLVTGLVTLAVTPAAAAATTAAVPITAYITNRTTGAGGNSVTPIDVATNTAGTAIPVGASPQGIAFSPDGTTVYVTNSGSNTITPINAATNTPGTPITVGLSPEGIVVTPDGTTAYVVLGGTAAVVPVNLVTGTAGTGIRNSRTPGAIAITPDGKTVYVTDLNNNTVLPGLSGCHDVRSRNQSPDTGGLGYLTCGDLRRRIPPVATRPPFPHGWGRVATPETAGFPPAERG